MNIPKLEIYPSRIGLVGFLLLALLPIPAVAHPEGFSGLRLRIDIPEATAVLTVHTRDMSRWFPPGDYPNYVPDVSAALAKSPSELIELRADGEPISPA